MDQKYSGYDFSVEKNIFLKNERGISFDEAIAAIQNGQILDIFQHPNKQKYPNQELMVINIRGYIYIIPFIKQKNGRIFLKTIYTSRKAKKHYLSGGNDDES